ncbi:ABC transporter substrate-binding protein [Roseomonas sp. 18066]|uniref:ABC transporter substrate-binding protein n=1 Tax=Roseomonas sp. 18066 TaxID=2681412 RepID=UPI0013569ADA|nr:ABC transporter substrate-binding protein [Roseomonas sp. 18066]
MTTRRQLLGSLAAGALAAPLAAPRLALAQDARILRFVPNADLAVLDPVWTTAYVTRNHAMLVFDTLYGHDAGYVPQPQMVEGHEVAADGLQWKLTLRESLRFHDNTPVLARDAVASIRRWGVRDGFGQRLMAATAELSAPDDRTILFRLKAPFPQLPDALGKGTNNLCVIMPQRLAETDPFRQVTEMVGSGPFRFVAEERVPGARNLYQRFDGYVPRQGTASFMAGPKRALVERVEWTTMPDPTSAAGALHTGGIDWWELPPPDLLPILRRDRALKVEVQDPNGYIGILRLNHLHAPFNDARVRRALLMAVNQADFMQAAVGDDRSAWRDGVGFFSPETPMANKAGIEAITGPRDLDKARAEIAAAGFAGAPVTLLAATDLPILNAIGLVAADLFTKLGFKLDYVATDFGTLIQRRASKEPLDKGGWSATAYFTGGLDQASPVTNTTLWSNGAAAAPGWPTSEKIEALRTDWIAAPDRSAQQKVAEAIQLQSLQDVPYVPLGQYIFATSYRTSLKGVGKGFPTFWGVEKG